MLTNIPSGLREIIAVFGELDDPQFEQNHIVAVDLPYPLLYSGAPVTKIHCHKLAADNFIQAFSKVKALGLEGQFKEFNGLYARRAIRGMPSHPSTHCVAGDAHVLAERGWIPMADVIVGDKVATFPECEMRDVSFRFPEAKKSLIGVRTRTRSLTTSAEHPYLVLKTNTVGRGQKLLKRYWTEWVKGGELKRGDWLMLLRKQIDTSTPSDLNEDSAEVVGLFLGDGCIGHRNGTPDYLSFSIPQLDASYAHCFDLLTRVFGAEPSVSRDPSNTQMLYYKRPLLRWICGLGLDHKAADKTLPAWVWQLSDSLKLALLRGYIYTDGTVAKSGQTNFKSASRALIEGVRYLCISLGLRVTNVTEEAGGERIIAGRETESSTRYQFGFVDTQGILKLDGHAGYASRLAERESRITRVMDYRSRGRAEHLLPECFGVESVIDVTDKGVGQVFDITVEKDHNFIANGLVVSNSWGIAIDMEAFDPKVGDPATHPLGSHNRLPDAIVNAFAQCGFEYGGDFTHRPDPMHLQLATGY